ncbi:acyl-CoA dehydratase activase [Desulfolucanica intricata]|uniref:acyl-CoA dehydratase activase n=1 Tax=Desulfolucanica intricata TaxID=1285191 RepID=UPI0008359248|nr:acyl-CoA dehydratase activase [Desulfolucanica intricata]
MYAGIDIGSRTIALVITDGQEIINARVVDTGYTPIQTAKELLAGEKFSRLIATGYGRHSARSEFADDIITEIKAHAIGARYFHPETRTILDIGGQDSKVILLNEKGGIIDFQMNDKCSAGTGKFLEVMANALGYSPDEFGHEALQGKKGIKISSMCTVFAESEAISLVHRGTPRQDIARALHISVAERAAGMLQRINFIPPLAFSGGVARNSCIVKFLEEKLQTKILVNRDPQLIGALGAALFASQIN